MVAHAAYIGLNGFPVVHGKVDDNFLDNSVNGSLDGRVLPARTGPPCWRASSPRKRSTTTVVLTRGIARRFGAAVGSTVSYQFPPGERAGPASRAAVHPLLPCGGHRRSAARPGRRVRHLGGATTVPPGATRQLLSAYYYAWIGLRLAPGTAGIPGLQRQLSSLSDRLEKQEEQLTGQKEAGPVFSINRTDVIHHQVQQAIMPEAVALSLFGAIAALALLVLVGQGLVQLISRSAPDIAVLRALGATLAGRLL